MPVLPSLAANIEWSGRNGASWATATNWNPATVPTINDTAVFFPLSNVSLTDSRSISGIDATGFVRIEATQPTNILSLGDAGILSRTGGTTEFVAKVALVGSTSRTFVIAEKNAFYDSFNMNNRNVVMRNSSGSFNAGTFLYGNTSGGAIVAVGDSTSTGGLYLQGTLSNATGSVGENSSSLAYALIDGAGSQWNNSQQLNVGNGIVDVSGGGVLTGRGVIGVNQGITGRITIRGTGSRWDSGSVEVGNAGNGNLEVRSGGVVNSESASIGQIRETTGFVSVDANASWSVRDSLSMSTDGGTSGLIVGGQVSVGGFGIALNSGATIYGAGGTLTTTSLAGRGSIQIGDLTINQSGDSVFAGTVENGNSGSNSLTKSGAGTLTLSGNNTYTGQTFVNEGTLKVTGTSKTSGYTVAPNASLLTGPGGLTLGAGQSLSGVGTITADVTNDSGIVAPGNSPGTLNIVGDYTQSGSGSYAIELASATVFDVLNITGTADFTGGAFSVTTLFGFTPTVGQFFDVVTTTGGITVGGVSVPDGYTFTQSGNNGRLTFVGGAAAVVPEANAGLLLLLAAPGLLAVRRRRE